MFKTTEARAASLRLSVQRSLCGISLPSRGVGVGGSPDSCAKSLLENLSVGQQFLFSTKIKAIFRLIS